MPTQADIANVSIRMVGGTRITSLTDGTNNANVIKDIYDPLLRDMLRYPWNFATKRVQLSRSATAPGFEFDYAYVLPADWVYTVSVHPDNSGLGNVFYKEEQVGGQKVLNSSSAQMWLRYVAYESDPNIWSDDFRRAFCSALARDLAIPIASSNTLYINLSKQADRDLAKARATDGLNSFPERRPLGSWVTARYGWRDGNDCQD